jgi:hypothetical protein
MERSIANSASSGSLVSSLTTIGHRLIQVLSGPEKSSDPDRNQLLTDEIERKMIQREFHCW